MFYEQVSVAMCGEGDVFVVTPTGCCSSAGRGNCFACDEWENNRSRAVLKIEIFCIVSLSRKVTYNTSNAFRSAFTERNDRFILRDPSSACKTCTVDILDIY